MPEKAVAVNSFTWWYTASRGKDHFLELEAELVDAKLIDKASTSS